MLGAAMENRAHDTTSELIDEVDATADHLPPDDLDKRIAESVRQAAQRVSDLVPRQSGQAEPGYLVVNPSSHVRRAAVDLPGLPSLPSVTKPVYAAHADEDHKYVVVDVPSMGFAWITGGPAAETAQRAPRRAGRGVSDLQRVL